jgi:uncharacterized membrane protein
MNMKIKFPHYKTDFLSGLAEILPAVVSISIVIWLFGKVANFTDNVLMFMPKDWTHTVNGEGSMHIYWSVLAVLLVILIIGLLGRIARYSFGKKLFQAVDMVLIRIPLLNKIYSILKHINGAFSSNKTATFKQVVMVEFPRSGIYSVGFITSIKNNEASAKTCESLLSVFVPTPPLTSGFIILVPESEIVKLDMSVAEGIKFIMSLGSVSSAYFSEGYFPNAEMVFSKGSGIPKNGKAMKANESDDLNRFEESTENNR